MKVKELIAALGEFDPEAQVVSTSYYGCHSGVHEPRLRLVGKGTNLIEEYVTQVISLCDESDIVLEDFILL